MISLSLLGKKRSCCFNGTVSSLAILFAVLSFFCKGSYAQTPLSGSYTIGVSEDYQSFSDAVSDLNSLGISGPVVFDVDPGVYSEQFTIDEIQGASAANTITFSGVTQSTGDVIVSFTPPTSLDNYVVKLNGADYIRFEYLCFTPFEETETAGVYGHVFRFPEGQMITPLPIVIYLVFPILKLPVMILLYCM